MPRALTHAETVEQRPRVRIEMETGLSDGRVSYKHVEWQLCIFAWYQEHGGGKSSTSRGDDKASDVIHDIWS